MAGRGRVRRDKVGLGKAGRDKAGWGKAWHARQDEANKLCMPRGSAQPG